jgi:hypothetical protein
MVCGLANIRRPSILSYEVITVAIIISKESEIRDL